MKNIESKNKEEILEYIRKNEIQKENIEKNIQKAKTILDTKGDWIDSVDRVKILRNLGLRIMTVHTVGYQGSCGTEFEIHSNSTEIEKVCYSYQLAKLALELDSAYELIGKWGDEYLEKVNDILSEIADIREEMQRREVEF